MLTSISGSSSYFNGSIVSYTNQSKVDLLNDYNDIDKYECLNKLWNKWLKVLEINFILIMEFQHQELQAQMEERKKNQLVLFGLLLQVKIELFQKN